MSPGRQTRSNSSGNISLDALKLILNDHKVEMMKCITPKLDEINSNIQMILTRISHIENTITSLKEMQDDQQSQIDSFKKAMSRAMLSPSEIMNEVEQRQNRSNNCIWPARKKVGIH